MRASSGHSKATSEKLQSILGGPSKASPHQGSTAGHQGCPGSFLPAKAKFLLWPHDFSVSGVREGPTGLQTRSTLV